MKNLLPYTREYTYKGKGLIFKAFEERIIDDVFTDSTGKSVFPQQLKITGYQRETGEVLGPYRNVDPIHYEDNSINNNQKYIYEFTNIDTKEKLLTARIEDIAEKLDSTRQNITKAFNRGQTRFKDWDMIRYDVDDYKKTNPGFFESKVKTDIEVPVVKNEESVVDEVKVDNRGRKNYIYTITKPDNSVIECDSLSKFCSENELSYASCSIKLKTSDTYKGYKITKRLKTDVIK